MGRLAVADLDAVAASNHRFGGPCPVIDSHYRPLDALSEGIHFQIDRPTVQRLDRGKGFDRTRRCRWRQNVAAAREPRRHQ